MGQDRTGFSGIAGERRTNLGDNEELVSSLQAISRQRSL